MYLCCPVSPSCFDKYFSGAQSGAGPTQIVTVTDPVTGQPVQQLIQTIKDPITGQYIQQTVPTSSQGIIILNIFYNFTDI